MTILATKLPSIDAEQFNLPGLQEFTTTDAWVINPYFEPPADVAVKPGPGQLHFGANQEPLSESPAEACQLPLLPDPPVWEAEPPRAPARPRKGRLARKRSNLGLSPGQMSLF
jgi:hypothetical protein